MLPSVSRSTRLLDASLQKFRSSPAGCCDERIRSQCKAVPFVELTVAHASVLTILAISFERYYAICEPLKAGYVCTKTRALLICLAAWTVAAILTR
uniref:G-protein coupled receptors family 1 profile domain-containing protein n=1 Tax=Anopheles quadriannulatus TaxID=34691 RepID=A0A182XHK8_ANOQN